MSGPLTIWRVQVQILATHLRRHVPLRTRCWPHGYMGLFPHRILAIMKARFCSDREMGCPDATFVSHRYLFALLRTSEAKEVTWSSSHRHCCPGPGSPRSGTLPHYTDYEGVIQIIILRGLDSRCKLASKRKGTKYPHLMNYRKNRCHLLWRIMNISLKFSLPPDKMIKYTTGSLSSHPTTEAAFGRHVFCFI